MSNKKHNKKKAKKPVIVKPIGKMMTGSATAGFSFKLAANFGTEEPFVVRVWLQLKEIMKFMTLEDEAEADFFFDRVVEQLEIARIHLGRIEDRGFRDQPTFDQHAEYVAFYNSIWWAYKDRFKNLMKQIGFDLGFVFQNDENFELGATNFLKKNPEATEFIEVARNDRNGWQNVLGMHRNRLHSGDRRGEKHDLDNPIDARMVFDNVWQAIEENFIHLGLAVMKDGWTIAHVPEDQRDKNIPVHYRPHLKGLLDGSIKFPPLTS